LPLRTHRGKAATIELTPRNGTTYFLVPGYAFDHAEKRRPVTANAPSFLVGEATIGPFDQWVASAHDALLAA
jgi:hypothetical protein